MIDVRTIAITSTEPCSPRDGSASHDHVGIWTATVACGGIPTLS